MDPAAENLLKILSKDYDIPLPKVMVSSSLDNKLSYVLPVKYWSNENYTRVVIMARSITMRSFSKRQRTARGDCISIFKKVISNRNIEHQFQ